MMYSLFEGERIFLRPKAWGKIRDIHHADRNKLTILGGRHIAAFSLLSVTTW